MISLEDMMDGLTDLRELPVYVVSSPTFCKIRPTMRAFEKRQQCYKMTHRLLSLLFVILAISTKMATPAKIRFGTFKHRYSVGHTLPSSSVKLSSIQTKHLDEL